MAVVVMLSIQRNREILYLKSKSFENLSMEKHLYIKNICKKKINGKMYWLFELFIALILFKITLEYYHRNHISFRLT